jgi:hypothetical protein
VTLGKAADLNARSRVGWIDAQVGEAEREQRPEHDAGHDYRKQAGACASPHCLSGLQHHDINMSTLLAQCGA